MINLSEAYRQVNLTEEEKPLGGFDAFISEGARRISSLYPHRFILLSEAKKIDKLSLTYSLLNDEQFAQKILDIRQKVKLSTGKNRQKIVRHAFAIICEASFRSLNIRPYRVQICGALAMYYNFIIQMYTGEGKTITAGLTAILQAWQGKPCHVVTSNDYLALRDTQTLEPFYTLCGLSVGFIDGEMKKEERRFNYKKSIVYATSNEILADFLRDQMEENYRENFNDLLLQKLKKEEDNNSVLQGLYNIIIDEADTLLADEATTPLIISLPKENKPFMEAIVSMKNVAQRLVLKEHYNLNNKYNEVYLTSEGEMLIETLTKELSPLWTSKNRREYLVKQALIAREFYLKGVHYVIVDEKLIIVDEKTGRLMPNRSWGNGLHQAVESKEGIPLSKPTETHIKMSFQRFFRFYKNVSGMSGTLQKLESEFWYIYKLKIMKIPKRIANNYRILKEKIVENKAKKWLVVVEEIGKIHKNKQPILVGTRTVEDSENLSKELTLLSISHQVLNALYHQEEAGIIAQAGKVGMVTIATNMAGRGTDIKVQEDALALGGLHIIATERHDSERVDMQLFGRTARQGQVGTVQRIVSLEDDLLVNKSSKWLLKYFNNYLSSFFGKHLILFFYKRIQQKSDKRASHIRKEILNNDFSAMSMLSFSKNKY